MFESSLLCWTLLLEQEYLLKGFKKTNIDGFLIKKIVLVIKGLGLLPDGDSATVWIRIL
jgi:hypothetical protein